MRGLIIGRFQPLHKGHLSVIKSVLKDCTALIIGIGSAQYSHTLQNPFSAGERYLMLARTLAAARLAENCHIVPIPDVNRYDVWVSHVESLVPPFDVVYTNNPLTKQLFLERGYLVKPTLLYDRKKYSGTEIRRRILADEDWQALVPRAVAEVINEIGGVGRLRTLAQTDAYTEDIELANILKDKEIKIAVAESCTGGMFSNRITNTPNASTYFEGGVVTYSRNAKLALGVPAKVLDAFGEVSPETTLELARKVRVRAHADVGVGITGYAGPSGDAGLVYIALVAAAEHVCKTYKFTGNREEVKEQAVREAMKLLKSLVERL